MIRASMMFLLMFGMTIAAEPPKTEPKTEGKDEKKVDPKVDMPKNEEEVDVQKTTERIAENAQKASGRLKEKDPGADTRKIQEEILKDLDALLKKAQQPPPPMDMNNMPPPPPMGPPPPPMGPPPPPMDGSSGMKDKPMPMSGNNPSPMSKGSNSPKSEGQSGSRGSRRERKQRGDSPMGPMPMAKNDKKEGDSPMPKMPDPKDGQAKEPMPKDGKDGKDGGKPDTFGKGSPKRKDKLDDLYKDVWGHLPERMRQEMDSYYREQFMPRYSDLLRRYYASLAEQRKKGDDR